MCLVLGVFVAQVLTAPYFYMPELPETSALLRVHPARISADKKPDVKDLQGSNFSPVNTAVNHSSYNSHRFYLQFGLYRLISSASVCLQCVT